MIWPKPSCASPFNFDKVLTAGRKAVYRILGPTAPPVAVRRPPRTQMPLRGNKLKLNT